MSLCIDCNQPKKQSDPRHPRCRGCATRRKHAAGLIPKQARDRITLSCEVCAATFEVQKYRAETARACSRACEHELKRRVTGTEHPLYKPKVSMACEVCGTVCQVKPSLVERFRFCSRECTGAWVIRNNPRVSSIEETTAAFLDAAEVAYQRQVAIGRFTADFLIGRTVVEVDGSYWHSRPKVAARDVRKNETYRQLGYEVIHLGEEAIRAGDFSGLEPVLQAAPERHAGESPCGCGGTARLPQR